MKTVGAAKTARGSLRRLIASFGFWAVSLLCAQTAHAQIFQTEAGWSSLHDAAGASLIIKSRNQEIRLGAGTLQGTFRIGTLVRTRARRFTISFGDSPVDVRMPTDAPGGSRYVSTRGASLSLARGDTKVFALAGASSTSYGASFFQAADWGEPLALLFVDRAINERVTLSSRNLFGQTNVVVNGLSWKARPYLDLKGAAGLAAGDRYLAASATLERPWVQARAGYVDAGRDFRTIPVERGAAAEADRESLSLTLSPRRTWSLHASRQHLVQASRAGVLSDRLAINQLSGTWNVLGFRAGSSLYAASGEATDHIGGTVNLGRQVTDGTAVEVNYFASRTKADERPTASVVASLRQSVHPRLSLTGYVTRTDGQTTLKAGGSFLSNLLTVSVDYNTVYAPFRPASPFVHGLALRTVIQPVGNIRLQLATAVMPNGDLRYSVSGSQRLYRRSSDSGGGQRHSMPKHVVRGRVVDDAGRAVAGAVLRVGSDVVLTADDGRFFVRTASDRQVPLLVAIDEFPRPRAYRVVSAPATVTPRSDDDLHELSIVVGSRYTLNASSPGSPSSPVTPTAVLDPRGPDSVVRVAEQGGKPEASNGTPPVIGSGTAEQRSPATMALQAGRPGSGVTSGQAGTHLFRPFPDCPPSRLSGPPDGIGSYEGLPFSRSCSFQFERGSQWTEIGETSNRGHAEASPEVPRALSTVAESGDSGTASGSQPPVAGPIDPASRLAANNESGDDAIVSRARNGNITPSKRDADPPSGYIASEAIDQSIPVITPPQRLSDEEMILGKIRGGEPFEHFDAIRRRNDGTRVNVSLAVSPAREATGVVVGSSTIAPNVSDRKRIEAKLGESLTRLTGLAIAFASLVGFVQRRRGALRRNRYRATNSNAAGTRRGGPDKKSERQDTTDENHAVD